MCLSQAFVTNFIKLCLCFIYLIILFLYLIYLYSVIIFTLSASYTTLIFFLTDGNNKIRAINAIWQAKNVYFIIFLFHYLQGPKILQRFDQLIR